MYAFDDDLVLPRLDEISTRGFVFIWSKDRRKIIGVVTAADLTLRFGEIARPFTMIEECERRLQRRVKLKIPPATLKEATKHSDASTLTFGSYWFMLKEAKYFQMLDWPLDHGVFVDRLHEVKDIRNEMMHFSPDPIPADEWNAIDGLLAMLRAVDPLP